MKRMSGLSAYFVRVLHVNTCSRVEHGCSSLASASQLAYSVGVGVCYCVQPTQQTDSRISGTRACWDVVHKNALVLALFVSYLGFLILILSVVSVFCCIVQPLAM